MLILLYIRSAGVRSSTMPKVRPTIVDATCNVAPVVRCAHLASWRHCAAGDSNTAAVERMLDMIAKNPQMQQMMMATLPHQLRKPEMLQQMLSNPQVREKIVEMLSKQV